jgi:hypothetical protein
MQKSKFSEEQIAMALRQGEADTNPSLPVKDGTREIGACPSIS